MNLSIAGRRLVLVCSALFIVALRPVTGQEEVGIQRGSEAPAVEVDGLDGGKVDLGEFIGVKPVLIKFWATWCEQCEQLAPSLDRAVERYGDQVAFFAVAVGVGQSKRAVRRHVERHSPGYPFLFDSNGAAVRAFQAPTTAYVVIIDAEGKVAYTGVGGNQDLLSAVESVFGSESGKDS
jgi:thiol-disulfide isomerase/thioredoxin